MENNPLRALFGVSSPLSEPKLVAPQPTAPTKNIGYEIPSGMIEQLLAYPYAGDRTEHPDIHLIYVDKFCGLFKLAGLPGDEAKKKVFPLSLKGKALGESIALAWGRLNSMLYSCPNHELSREIIIHNFMPSFLVMINPCLILLGLVLL